MRPRAAWASNSPRPSSRHRIPPALAGQDVLAGAETGSGKTAAFLLPIMNKLLPMQRGATRALVLAPTRELAAQIAEHFRELAVGTSLTCAAIFGGVGMGSQERAFRKGVDVIVACPGRLLDHMRGRYAEMSGAAVPRPRRGGPHAGHGLPAGHQADPCRDPEEPPDAVLLRDAASRHHRAFPAPACAIPCRSTSTGWRHPLRVFPTPCTRLPRRASPAFSWSSWAGASREASWSSRAQSTAPTAWPSSSDKNGVALRADPRQPQPVAAHRGAGRVQEGKLQGPRGHRHRRARHRRGGAWLRGQLRCSPPGGGLHPPRGTHGARPADRGCLHAACPPRKNATSAPSRKRSASVSPGTAWKALTTRRSRRPRARRHTPRPGAHPRRGSSILLEG